LHHTGAVPMAGHRIQVGTLAADTAQDNFVAFSSAADLTLGTSGLVESGAVLGSPTFTPVDSVLLVDNAAPGLNKAFAGVYFYYTGTGFGGPGWRKQGGTLTRLYNDEVLSADAGLLIRKGRTLSPDGYWWKLAPGYVD